MFSGRDAVAGLARSARFYCVSTCCHLCLSQGMLKLPASSYYAACGAFPHRHGSHAMIYDTVAINTVQGGGN